MQTRQQLVEFLGAAPRRVHFIGIGGCGMSGLARLLLQQGHQVTGTDLSANGETRALKSLGARIRVGHAAKNLPADTELVVFSSAVNPANEELRAANESKLPVVRRGLLLTALMNHRNNIAVAGTHGKTTTTAMIAHVLTRSDSPPSFCVGAQVPSLGTNAQLGAGQNFVAEADESDGTLIGFTPEYAVCLNIESEHLDYHGSMEKLLATFESFLKSTLRTVFYCADCQNCAALAGKHRNAVSFGLAPQADYRALNIQPTERGSRFAVWCRDQQMGEIELQIPGWQNVVNALAAIAVADELGVPFVKIAETLAQFTGAKRRFDRKFDGGGILVVDDYAHHPTEIRATIAAARAVMQAETGKPFRRVLLAFQPHRYTRTKALREQFATAFRGVDRLFLTEIYAASEEPMAGVTGQTLVETVRATGQQHVEFAPDLESLTERLLEEAQAGDLILTMGAGDIYTVSDRVAQTLSACAPQAGNRAGKAAGGIETDLRRLLSDDAKLRVDEPLARHTSLKVGGPAEYWVEPHDEKDLAKVLKYAHEREIPVTLVGRGTNLLVRDGGIPGVVIHLGSAEFSKVEVDGERIIARAGARLKSVVNAAKAASIGGFEFMEGIPGSLGGALRMNAGAMGRQTFDVVEWVRYVSLTGEVYDAKTDRKSVV